MLCNQFRHTASHDLEVLYTEQILIEVHNIFYKQIPPVVYFLPVTSFKNKKSLFVNIAEVY